MTLTSWASVSSFKQPWTWRCSWALRLSSPFLLLSVILAAWWERCKLSKPDPSQGKILELTLFKIHHSA